MREMRAVLWHAGFAHVPQQMPIPLVKREQLPRCPAASIEARQLEQQRVSAATQTARRVLNSIQQFGSPVPKDKWRIWVRDAHQR